MGESQIPRRLSVHQALGGGSVNVNFAGIVFDEETVADIMLWRNWPESTLVLISATSFWLLFERGGYDVLPFTANVLLLLIIILFLWAKSASLLNRPLPPIPDLEIEDASVEKAAEALRVWINRVLPVAREIAVNGSFKVLFQVAITLWVLIYVGSLCDFLTMVYIAILLSLSVPPFYDKYQGPIDRKLSLLNRIIKVQFRKVDKSVLRRIPVPMNQGKRKKTQ